MTRLLMLVEGQSEESFVKRTLAPHLAGYGVFVQVIVLWTKRLASGGGLTHIVRRPSLADGQQCNLRRVASARPGSGIDTRQDGLQVGGDCSHNRIFRMPEV